LFPTGAADFLAPRQNKVTIGNYLKHLMLYDDGRLSKHCRFRYFALNTEMRWRAIQTGRVYVHQNLRGHHLLKNCATWWGGKQKAFQVEYSIMLLVCVVLVSTGCGKEVIL